MQRSEMKEVPKSPSTIFSRHFLGDIILARESKNILRRALPSYPFIPIVPYPLPIAQTTYHYSLIIIPFTSFRTNEGSVRKKVKENEEGRRVSLGL